jgi:hypothetical protein
MAGKTDAWDYALRIRGVTPRGLLLSRLGEYMRAYAALLGEGNEPKFAGIVKGSAVLRASVPSEQRAPTRRRLLVVSSRSAATPEDLAAQRARDQIADMLQQDQSTGDVEDPTGAVILKFERRNPAADQREYIVHDTAVIDGVVVSLRGIDDTVHLQLLDSEKCTHNVVVRDIAEARKLARHFRGDKLRARVHGTWRRTPEGEWKPHNLYLDGFEELSDASAGEVLDALASLGGERWSTMDDPQLLVRQLRGDG